MAFRTTFRTFIFAAASKLSRITSNSLFSSAAAASPSPPPAPGAAITTPAEAAADTPNVSSICFTSSEASRSESDFNDSRISSVFADIFFSE